MSSRGRWAGIQVEAGTLQRGGTHSAIEVLGARRMECQQCGRSRAGLCLKLCPRLCPYELRGALGACFGVERSSGRCSGKQSSHVRVQPAARTTPDLAPLSRTPKVGPFYELTRITAPAAMPLSSPLMSLLFALNPPSPPGLPARKHTIATARPRPQNLIGCSQSTWSGVWWVSRKCRRPRQSCRAPLPCGTRTRS